MIFPLSLSDVSLWLAVTAIILLVTSELVLSLPAFSTIILTDKTRLRAVAIGCGLAFLATVAWHAVHPF
jgi:uncharacterized membrane protein (UPF0182 family)